MQNTLTVHQKETNFGKHLLVILIGIFMVHTASTQQVVWWCHIFIKCGLTYGTLSIKVRLCFHHVAKVQ